MQRVLFAMAGVVINVLMAFLMNLLGLHLFLDTIGTIAVSAVGGLFSGILTAVGTNAVCALFNVNYIYFGFLNALVAILVAIFVRKRLYKKIWLIGVFITFLALFSGSVGCLISWFLMDGAIVAKNTDATNVISAATGLGMFWSYFIFSF